jgi:hypothetical protein
MPREIRVIHLPPQTEIEIDTWLQSFVANFRDQNMPTPGPLPILNEIKKAKLLSLGSSAKVSLPNRTKLRLLSQPSYDGGLDYLIASSPLAG